MWSESLSWQTRSPFLLGGPTLTDTQVFSMRHLFLQSLWGSIPMDKYICLKTCCCRAYPPIGLSNIRLRYWVPATDWLEIWWQACWTFFFFFAPNSKTNSCSPDMFIPFIGAWAAGISPTSARNLVNFPNFSSMLNQWWSNCRLVVAQMSHRLKREGASSNIAENSFINLWLSSNDTFITWEDSREVNLSALTHPWAVHFWIRNRAKSRNVRSTYLPYLLEPSWGLLVLGCFSTDRCDLRPIFPSTALSTVGKKSVIKAFG